MYVHHSSYTVLYIIVYIYCIEGSGEQVHKHYPTECHLEAFCGVKSSKGLTNRNLYTIVIVGGEFMFILHSVVAFITLCMILIGCFCIYASGMWGNPWYMQATYVAGVMFVLMSFFFLKVYMIGLEKMAETQHKSEELLSETEKKLKEIKERRSGSSS